MKTLPKTMLHLQIAAMFLTAALPNCGAADPVVVPFRGSLEGVLENVTVQFPTLSVQGSDTGTATQLGQFAATWVEEVNLISNVGIGSGRLVGANGDSIFYEFIGVGSPTAIPNQVFVVETATITGGTGRFVGVTGSFVAELLVDLAARVSVGSFTGTLVLREGT